MDTVKIYYFCNILSEKVMNEVEAEDEVNKIMTQVDKNNSGLIDYSGFKFKLNKFRIRFGNI